MWGLFTSDFPRRAAPSIPCASSTNDSYSLPGKRGGKRETMRKGECGRQEERRKQLDKASYLYCVPPCAQALSCSLKGRTLNSCSRMRLLFFFLLAALAEKGWGESRYYSQVVSFVLSFGVCRLYIQTVTQSLNIFPLCHSPRLQINTQMQVVTQTCRHARTRTIYSVQSVFQIKG